MKEKIAIIGASEFQNPLILRAKEKGYETHVFAWEAGDIGEKQPMSFTLSALLIRKRFWKSAKPRRLRESAPLAQIWRP